VTVPGAALDGNTHHDATPPATGHSSSSLSTKAVNLQNQSSSSSHQNMNTPSPLTQHDNSISVDDNALAKSTRPSYPDFMSSSPLTELAFSMSEEEDAGAADDRDTVDIEKTPEGGEYVHSCIQPTLMRRRRKFGLRRA
jgi:hypothetical protein